LKKLELPKKIKLVDVAIVAASVLAAAGRRLRKIFGRINYGIR